MDIDKDMDEYANMEIDESVWFSEGVYLKVSRDP